MANRTLECIFRRSDRYQVVFRKRQESLELDTSGVDTPVTQLFLNGVQGIHHVREYLGCYNTLRYDDNVPRDCSTLNGPWVTAQPYEVSAYFGGW